MFACIFYNFSIDRYLLTFILTYMYVQCTFYIHDHTDHNHISPDQIAKAYLTSSVGSLIPLFLNTIIVKQSN